MSQPSSCTFSRIIPTTCAPSTAERIPFVRASPQSSFAGNTTPVTVGMWLKNMTRVRGVMASLKRFNTAAALGTGFGSVTFFTTIPYRFARRFHGCSPPGCSWSVINTSSPDFMSRPFAMKLFASVALRTSASSSRVHPTNSASGSRNSFHAPYPQIG